MNAEDIQFSKDEISKAVIKTPFGKELPLPWSLLRTAIETIENLSNSRTTPSFHDVEEFYKGPAPKPYFAEHESIIEYLKRIESAANDACTEAADNSHGIGGGVNWHRLACADVLLCLSVAGNFTYRVEIRRAAPGSSELIDFVSDYLKSRGYPGVEVTTEW